MPIDTVETSSCSKSTDDELADVVEHDVGAGPVVDLQLEHARAPEQRARLVDGRAAGRGPACDRCRAVRRTRTPAACPSTAAAGTPAPSGASSKPGPIGSSHRVAHAVLAKRSTTCSGPCSSNGAGGMPGSVATELTPSSAPRRSPSGGRRRSARGFVLGRAAPRAEEREQAAEQHDDASGAEQHRPPRQPTACQAVDAVQRRWSRRWTRPSTPRRGTSASTTAPAAAVAWWKASTAPVSDMPQ